MVKGAREGRIVKRALRYHGAPSLLHRLKVSLASAKKAETRPRGSLWSRMMTSSGVFPARENQMRCSKPVLLC
jgi:hypothetical protein